MQTDLFYREVLIIKSQIYKVINVPTSLCANTTNLFSNVLLFNIKYMKLGLLRSCIF